jgi:prevent-host-death family protein
MVTKRSAAIRSVTAAEFKARCLGLMDRVAASGKPIVITKRGKPVAQLAPIRTRPTSLRGFLKGTFAVRGDIVAPLDLEWDAERS